MVSPDLIQGQLTFVINIYVLLLIPVGELWACIISYLYTPCPEKAEAFTLLGQT